MDINIRITQSSRQPDAERLRIADRYTERAEAAISRDERVALLREADRIYTEEGL